MEFVDGAARTWRVPAQTLTDGASIPRIFVPIVGAPMSPEFIKAAALHDAYCESGNEASPVYHSRMWQETHRMFYDTLIVGGTPGLKAKVMFAAVWLCGPRWYGRSGRVDTTMERRLLTALRLAAMRDMRDDINRSDPSPDAVLGYLKWTERRMLRAANGDPSGESSPAPVQVASAQEEALHSVGD